MHPAGKDILMNISPAIIIDVALIAVIVVSVFHYARKGFVAGLMDLVGNLASLALAWVVSGKLSPTVFENFFKSGLIEQTAVPTSSRAGEPVRHSGRPFGHPAAEVHRRYHGFCGRHAGFRRSGYCSAGGGKDHCAAGGAAHHRSGVFCHICAVPCRHCIPCHCAHQYQ